MRTIPISNTDAVNPVQRVYPVTSLFAHLREQAPKSREPVSLDAYITISPLAKALSHLSNCPCNKLELELRKASLQLNIPEVTLKDYVLGTHFLEYLDNRDPKTIPVDEKTQILARTRTICPALGYLLPAKLGDTSRALVDFPAEDINRTFSNQINAVKNRVNYFNKRYQ